VKVVSAVPVIPGDCEAVWPPVELTKGADEGDICGVCSALWELILVSGIAELDEKEPVGLVGLVSAAEVISGVDREDTLTLAVGLSEDKVVGD